MEVVFGWFLDGPTYPETVSGALAAFNSAVCGPAKLLNILETALGVGAPPAGRAVRVGEYLSKLQTCDDGNFFFSRSLEVDPWATAQELLELRDQLIAGGWNLGAVPNNQKIDALRAVELIGDISLGPAERLIRINSELKRRRKSPIHTLRLASDPDSLPRLWQQAIQNLKALGTVVVPVETQPERSTNTDLKRFKSAYQQTGRAEGISADGTLVLVDADDELQASEFTAAWLAALRSPEDLVIIRGSDVCVLDEACFRYGLPRIGSQTESPHRSLLQLLPLALELIWTPFDAIRALEFLSIEGGPIPGSLSWFLRDALKRQPGLGGPLWEKAWLSIQSERRLQLERKGVEQHKLDESVREDVARWQEWFTPLARRNDAVRAAVAETICRRVEEWAMRRASVEQGHAFYDLAHHHASTLRKILTHYTTRVMTLHQLRSMVESVISEGAVSNFTEAEASPWTVVDHPGQIWNTGKTVLWWNFISTSATTIRRSRWTDSELAAFNECGIAIDTPQQQARRESTAWRTALLSCSERLIVIKPRAANGKLITAHPASDELYAVLGHVGSMSCKINASDIFFNETLTASQETLKRIGVEPRKLPSILRHWSVTPGTIKNREQESFTSIERLLGCSLAWTLEYGAKLRTGVNWSISEGERLIGELAHAVIAQLLTESKIWKPVEAAERAIELVDDLVPKLASSLLLPGATSQLRKAKDSIRRSVMHLVMLINDAKLTVIAPEAPIEGAFLDGKLGGSIDLLLETSTNNKLVLDLKWSHYPRSYKAKLQEGKALQLAAYTSVVAGDQPNARRLAGFFLLRQSLLYFNSDDIFPKYTFVASDSSLEDTWLMATDHFKQTMNQLQQGKLTATGIDTDNNPIPDGWLVEPPCGFCNFNTFCGKRTFR